MNRKPYPSDMSDQEWEVVEPLLHKEVYRGAGSKGKYSRREMLNSIFYVLRTGCQWTDLPHDFPPWKSVYSQFLRWRDKELFMKLNDVLRKKLRKLLG
ncbi:MAG: transposase, partial [Candidatus Thorarchaeota archaeon]|nr:transposase [Candidatus Thorarchaeota archaeon]NIW15539.1 transposase [Candidatus Thorarchaeota archaeon]NIW53485.1 transposase [Candidatus Korarchaeota archaeon]